MNELVFSGIDEDGLHLVASQIISFTDSKLLLFSAEMGSGKTTLISQICVQLGVKEGVSSPTFSLVNEYHGSEEKIYHFDFYRLDSIEELLDIGMEDYLDEDAWFCIEWPDLGMPLIDRDYLRINILKTKEGKRDILCRKENVNVNRV